MLLFWPVKNGRGGSTTVLVRPKAKLYFEAMDAVQCQQCGRAIEPGQEYRHLGKTLCVECCVEARATRPRKTHWQYLTAIRSGYLQEGNNKGKK